MPFLLRKIRKARWYSSSPSWLISGEPQADALVDLSTKNNHLSVWLIEDDKSNLERIIAALAASCEALSNFDYALLNLSDVEELKLQFQAVSGETADDIANDQWHRDLIELSARKILELADSMQTKAQFQRLNEQSITRIVKESIERKTIDDSRINLKGNSRQKVVK